MKMRIVTKYTTNASGRSQVVAKGGGKQRTTSFNPADSFDRNYGNAAGTLVLALGVQGSALAALDNGTMTHEAIDPSTHVFKF